MSNPTHILIPIKDIEGRINLRKNDSIYEKIHKEIKQHNGVSPQQKIAKAKLDAEIGVLTELLSYYKQISLDEKDIEKRAISYSENLPNSEYLYMTQKLMIETGYKQALKELL